MPKGRSLLGIIEFVCVSAGFEGSSAIEDEVAFDMTFVASSIQLSSMLSADFMMGENDDADVNSLDRNDCDSWDDFLGVACMRVSK